MLALLAAVAAMWTSPTLAQQRAYSLDSAQARVLFSVRQFGLPWIEGGFSDVSATLVLDRTRPEDASLHVEIRSGSVFATAQAAAMRRAFEPERYPVIRFVSTRVAMETETSARIEGLLSLHGVTRPVTLVSSLSSDDRMEFSASGRFRRSAFGLRSWGWAGDWIELTISAPFSAQR
jgi:polyisoprenoid-binding protein YceI